MTDQAPLPETPTSPSPSPDLWAAVDDLWTWGYEACGHMSALAGSDPATVWDVICDAMLTGVRA